MTKYQALKLARTMCTPEAIALVSSWNEYMKACDRFRRGIGSYDAKLETTTKYKTNRTAFIESLGRELT